MLLQGGFVKLPGRLGLGKLAWARNGQAGVHVFHSPSKRETKIYARSLLERGFIGPQTRVFTLIDGRWRIGRVKDYFRRDDGMIAYEIRFANQNTINILESDLEVRCLTAIEDPAAVLAAGSAESQFFHDRRRRASERMVSTQAAVRGLSALLSSAIELVPHQIAAVRRVLSDPVQRYLLADEVGMGKTIEAGVIMRQCLIDDPTRRVTVFVPPSLLKQWKDELASKFRSADFPQSLEVQPYSHAGATGVPVPDLMVVDEAHRVIADPSIRVLALAAPRLLLLSATPVLDDEPTFLALLHLLDPDVNRLDEFEAFRLKVAESQAFGRLLLGLQPDVPGFVLRERLAESIARCPEDELVLEFASSAKDALDAKDALRLQVACRALQVHIADTYRIHQRVIRSRRSDARVSDFQARRSTTMLGQHTAAQRITVEIDENESTPDIVAAIEDCRETSLQATETWPHEHRLKVARQFFGLLGEAGKSLDGVTRRSLTLTDEDIPGATQLARSLAELSDKNPNSNNRIDLAHQSLQLMRTTVVNDGHAEPKIVAFFTDIDAAQALYKKFRPSEAVFLGGNISGEIDRFTSDPRTWVLICDIAGEEGINLHFAHAILHADLPFSAARLEQRVGRLDRFGRRIAGIHQRLILPYDEEGSIWDAWFRVLLDSFRVFDRSISDVQFLLSKLEDELALACWERGATGLLEMSDSVSLRIASERTRQDKQYALDQIALSDEKVEEYIVGLEQTESDEASLERDMRGWIEEVMGLRRRRAVWPERDPFRLEWTEQTRVPKDPWHALFGRDLGRPLTWRRQIASALKDVSLLRQGTPLVDSCERYMRWDDRGSTFITWRVEPGWGTADDAWTGFRLCFIIEPAIPDGETILANVDLDGIRRRAQSYLPPWTKTLHVNSAGEPVSVVDLLDTLERPYSREECDDGRIDVNLGSRPSVLHDIIDPESFSRLCLEMRERARSLMSSDQDFIRSVDRATNRAKMDFNLFARRMRQRLATEHHAKAIFETEQRANDIVLAAIEHPRIRLDAFGFFVVAGVPPRTHA